MKLAEGYKRRIAAALPLRKRVSLARVLQEIESAMQRFWTEIYHEDRSYVEFREDSWWWAPRQRETRGRPRKEALRSYLTTVVGIYGRATGKRLGRNIETPSKGAKEERQTGRNRTQQHREKIHPFVLACVKAVGLPTGPKYHYGYPAGIVKQVLHDLYPDVKRGRPRR